ncbi:MAG: InlB B-repeat-containing protein, partial [Clostridia bacterium]|nr:InlB B-repeat-containing protein [Clostridia bacterium]
TAGDATEYIEKTFRSMKTVTFSGDGASALSGLWRAFGSTINLTKITPEAREGYTFTGWYADPACTKPITKLVVTGDMELYAGWEEIAVEEEEEATEAPAEEAAAE